MAQQDLGVNINAMLVVKAPVNTAGYTQKTATLKTALLGITGVKGVTSSGAIPGKEEGEFLANRPFGAPTRSSA